MRSIYLVLLCSCLGYVLAGQSKEEMAIRKVIDAETQAVFSEDFEAWASHWYKDQVHFLYSDKGAVFQFDDWNTLAETMKENLGGDLNFQRTNFRYLIDGNLAWVSFDQKEKDQYKKEQRTLVKKEGAWKIVNMTAADVKSYERDPATPIRRIIYVSYKDGTDPKKITTSKNKFYEMVDLIDGMEKAVWMKATEPNSAYQYSLLLEFKDEKALETYEVHPNHLAVMEIGKDIVSGVLVQTF